MKLTEAQAVTTRNWRFQRHQGQWSINQLFWDPARSDAHPGQDNVEIWSFDNKAGGWFHPIHVHLGRSARAARTRSPPPRRGR